MFKSLFFLTILLATYHLALGETISGNVGYCNGKGNCGSGVATPPAAVIPNPAAPKEQRNDTTSPEPTTARPSGYHNEPNTPYTPETTRSTVS